MFETFLQKNRCCHGTIINRPNINNKRHHKQSLQINGQQNQSTLTHKPQSVPKNQNIKQKQYCQLASGENQVMKTKLVKQHHHQMENSCSELMTLLIDENSNLKEQNMYLQTQLSKCIHKNKELTQTVLEYQSIMSLLNAQNVRLHQQLLHFSNNANSKVDKLKSTINKFIKNNKICRHQTDQDQEDTFIISSFDHEKQDIEKLKRHKSEKRFIGVNQHWKQDSKPPSLHLNIKMDQFSFDTLLEECRRQQDPDKRKEIRRKLIELTYKQSSLY